MAELAEMVLFGRFVCAPPKSSIGATFDADRQQRQQIAGFDEITEYELSAYLVAREESHFGTSPVSEAIPVELRRSG